jgi:TPR repeat protein
MDASAFADLKSDSIPIEGENKTFYYTNCFAVLHTEGQLMPAHCLIHGDGVSVDVQEAERYFQFACSQGDTIGQMHDDLV